MNPLLSSPLIKLVGPLATIMVLCIVVRVRRLSWRRDIALVAPRASSAALWLLAWIAWMAATESVIHALGIPQAAPWPAYPPLIVALRVAAIGILGPAAEELVMRGLALGRLRPTRLGTVRAVVLVAAAWAALHVSYDLPTIALIFLDGLLLGAARIQSGSIWVPIAMHAIGNLFSIWQSTHT